MAASIHWGSFLVLVTKALLFGVLIRGADFGKTATSDFFSLTWLLTTYTVTNVCNIQGLQSSTTYQNKYMLPVSLEAMLKLLT